MTVFGCAIHTIVAVYSAEVGALVLFHWLILLLSLAFVHASECRDIEILNALLQWRSVSRNNVMHITIASCTETLRVCDMFTHAVLCPTCRRTALNLSVF